ncbi:MAG: PQQ-dependent sugar dehydrogenase [Saprospiraceae bacterium]|nr:PQQ-dependent sugar dehydrogenase [Saprospiraceae bacterium]
MRSILLYSFVLQLILTNVSAQPGMVFTELVQNLNRPVDLAFAPGITNRIYVVEQRGTIRIVENGTITSMFLDVRDRVDADGELGLLGLAFDPEFQSNGIFYINYAASINGRLQTTIARRFVDHPTDEAASDREEIVLQFDQPFKNHNAGDLAFGPDGMLYITTGDGGSANDPAGNGQNLDTLLGKLLRVDVRDQTTYAIPDDNPFIGQPGVRPEIWAYGLRNPWRIGFDRNTGDLWIGDVGQDKWEEVSMIPAGQAGLNFGWRCFEGDHLFRDCGSIDHAVPVYVYAHTDNCSDARFCGESITGGFRYRGANPSMEGLYFFADYEKNRLWALDQSAGQASSVIPIDFPYVHTTTFGEDLAGELYFATIEGHLYRIDADASTGLSLDPLSDLSCYPNPASSVVHLGTIYSQDLHYRWIQANGVVSAWTTLANGTGEIKIPAGQARVAWLQVRNLEGHSRLFMVEILR